MALWGLLPCAVLVYVSEEDRRHFADILVEASKKRDIVWVSNESATVVPEIQQGSAEKVLTDALHN